MNDIDAIKKCQMGKTESFSFLIKKYQKEAYSHAITILGNPDDALDAVQDAFLDAFRALEKFNITKRFYPWLYTILRNRCYKILASRNRETTIETDQLQILASPKEKTFRLEVSLVEQALVELSPQDREILTLKHLDGLSYDELARRLDIPVGTVMSRLYYARLRFREKVDRIRKQDDFREIK